MKNKLLFCNGLVLEESYVGDPRSNANTPIF